ERQLDAAIRSAADPGQRQSKLDLARKSGREVRRDGIVAPQQVGALVAEDAERCEFRSPIGMDEQQEIERALLRRVQTVFGLVGFDDCGPGDVSGGNARGVISIEVIEKTRVVEL